MALPSITHSDESIEAWLSTVDHLAEVGAVVELIDSKGESLGDHVILLANRDTPDGIPVLLVERWRDFAPNIKGDQRTLTLDDISDVRIY